MTLSAIAQMRHDAVLDSGWWEDVMVRLDDANFTEDKHPRGPDGKFIKGSGTKIATKSFMDTMKKAGKTVTKSALIKHLLSGGHHQDDVIEAVKDEFPQDSAAVDKAYVKYYHNQLAKVTPAFPPLKPGSSGEKYHGEAEPATPEEPKPFAFPVSKPPSEAKKFQNQLAEDYGHQLATLKLDADPSDMTLKSYVDDIDYALHAAEPQEGLQMINNLVKIHHPDNDTQHDLNDLLSNLKGELLAKSASLPAAAPTPFEASAPVPKKTSLPMSELKEMYGEDLQNLYQDTSQYDETALSNIKNLMHHLQEDSSKGLETTKPIAIPYTEDQKNFNKLLAKIKEDAGLEAQPPKPIPVAAQPMHKLSSDSKKFLSDQVEKYIGESKVAGTKEKYHAVISALDTKGSVEDQQNAVGKLETFPNPSGMLQQSLNKFIEKAQLDYGVQKLQSSVPAAGSKPTPAQQKKCQDGVYHALVKAPLKKIHQITYHEDANGNEVASVLKADTSKIPGDHYSKVTAAYGLDPNPSSPAVDKAMQAYGEAMYNKRGGDANEAISYYQGSGYHKINAALLNPEVSHSPTIKKMVKEVHQAISSEHLPADTPLVRGLKCTLKNLAGFDSIEDSIGRVFAHKNFCSASRRELVAEGFAGSKNRVLLHFTAPAGCNALVMHVGQTGGESETVLPANSMFRIDKIEKSTNLGGYDVHKVHCTYLGVKENG